MRKTNCVLKVSELIERYENQLAPNYKPPPPPTAKVGTIYNFHKEKWLYVLRYNPNGDNRVINLRASLRNRGISYNQFSAIMSDIYAVTSKVIHFPSTVQNVTNEEVIQVFENDYQFIDIIQRECLRLCNG